MDRDDKKEPDWTLAPHIKEVAELAATILPSLGGQGVSALATLAEVTNGQASRWVNGLQRVPLRRALMVEMNSGHRIRAEELLPEDEAFLLIAVRLASRPTPEQILAWPGALDSDQDAAVMWRELASKASQKSGGGGRLRPTQNRKGND